MKRRSNLLGLLLGTAAFMAAVLALTVTPAARATEPVTFTDPAGDAGGAPDVTAVTISERDGIFKVVVDATAVKTEDGFTYVSGVFDSDRNQATGDENGVENWFSFGYDNGEAYVIFETWAGDHFVTMTEGPDMSFTPGAGEYTVLFNQADFGIGSAADFFVVTGAEDSTGHDIVGDNAPDLTEGAYTWWTFHITASPWTVPGSLSGLLGDGSVYVLGEDGLFHYIDPTTLKVEGYDWNAVSWFGTLPGTIGAPVPPVAAPVVTPAVPRAPESVTVVVPAIGKGFTTPAKVLAGKKVVVSFPVTNVATGGPVTTVTMIAGNPKIGKTIVRHVESFSNGMATITLTVPKNAQGKALQVALKIKTGEQLASRTQAFVIR